MAAGVARERVGYAPDRAALDEFAGAHDHRIVRYALAAAIVVVALARPSMPFPTGIFRSELDA